MPMYELVFTVHSGNWDRMLLPQIRPLAELVRPGRFIPDFFNSVRPDFADAVRQVLDVPSTRVRDQIASMLGTTSPWLRSYAAGTLTSTSCCSSAGSTVRSRRGASSGARHVTRRLIAMR